MKYLKNFLTQFKDFFLQRVAHHKPKFDPNVCGNAVVVTLSDEELAKRKIYRKQIATVHLTSGQIVVCDPLVQPERPPMIQKVPPGDYPVILYMASYPGVAEIRFSDQPAVHWEMALIEGQKLGDLNDDEVFGFPVDTGLACVMDANAQLNMKMREELEKKKKQDDDLNYYDEVLALDLDRDSSDDIDWCNHYPIGGNPHNCVVFKSGWGDGYYASYWGFDKTDKPSVLLIDLNVFENGDARDEYDLMIEQEINKLTEPQQQAMQEAYKFIERDCLVELRRLLADKKINPEWIIPKAHESLTFAAVQLDKPDALAVLMEHGAAKNLPDYIELTGVKTYLDYANNLRDKRCTDTMALLEKLCNG